MANTWLDTIRNAIGTGPISSTRDSRATIVQNNKTVENQKGNVAKTQDQATSIPTISFTESVGAYWTSIGISEYSGSLDLSAGQITHTTSSTIGNYQLPIPLNLIDTNSVEWNNDTLYNASAVTSAIISRIGAERLSGVIGSMNTFSKATTGTTMNEFMTMLFKGPVFKKVNLAWLVSPRNSQESEKVNNIIRAFKNAQAPSLEYGGAMFKFPKVFKIKFMTKTGENKYLYKFKPCVLESMSVNYAAGGVPGFYKGTGAPEALLIECQFIELEFWLSGEF